MRNPIALGTCLRWCMLAAAGLATISAAHAMTLDEVLALPEQQQREALEDTVGRWFLAEDFAHIESFAETARAKGLRTSSGLWVSGFVSGGIDSVANFHEVKDDAGWDRLEAIAQRWIAACPRSATAKIAYASILQNRAWLYRGGGYANTVSAKQLAAFYRQVEKAKQYQLATRDLAGTDPTGT